MRLPQRGQRTVLFFRQRGQRPGGAIRIEGRRKWEGQRNEGARDQAGFDHGGLRRGRRTRFLLRRGGKGGHLEVRRGTGRGRDWTTGGADGGERPDGGRGRADDLLRGAGT